jgi:hypothetical protein
MAGKRVKRFERSAVEAEQLASTLGHLATKRDMLARVDFYRQAAARARMRAKAKLRSPRSLDVGKVRKEQK